MSLADCLGKLKLSPERAAEIKKAAKKYVRQGLDRAEAEKAAIRDSIDDANGTIDQLREKVKAPEPVSIDAPAPKQEPQTVNQADQTRQQGATVFTPDHAIIKLMRADRSTLLHESGHVWLDYLHRQAKSGNDNIDSAAQWSAIKKFLDINDDQEKLTTEQHEKWARHLEAYVMEGKAPNGYLKSAFRNFSRWLMRVYQNVQGLSHQAGFEVNVSPEAKEIFDRLLSAEHETTRAEEAANANIGNVDPEGLPDSVKRQLETLKEKAHGEAFDELVRAQMKEVTQDHKDEIQAKRDKLEPEVRKNIEERPIYKAMSDMKDAFGKGAKTAAEEYLAGKMSNDDQTAIEIFAQHAGFSSADHLANVVIKTDSVESAVKQALDAQMEPHLKDSTQLRQMAEDAVHNADRLKLLALEAEILDRKLLKAKTDEANKDLLRNAAKPEDVLKSARASLEELPANEAGNYRRYYTAERNAAVKVAKALKDKDFKAAADAKRQQMLAHAMAIESQKLSKEYQKTVKYLSGFKNIGNDFQGMPYSFARQIDKVLTQFEINKPRTEDSESLTKIADGMAQAGEDPYDIANATGLKQTDSGWAPETIQDFTTRLNESFHAVSFPDAIMNEQGQKFETVTTALLRDIRDAVKTIETNGKKNDRFLEAFDRADISEEGRRFRSSVEASVGVPHAADLLPGSKHKSKASELIGKVPEFYSAFERIFSTMDTTADTLDGFKEGPAKNNITRPLAEAESRAKIRTAKAIEKADKIFSKYYTPKEFAEYKKRNIEIDGRYFSKEEILSMALNRGNDGNIQRLLGGFRWDLPKLDAILNEHLSKKDFDFCQETWDHINEYKPDIIKLEMEVNGFVPKMVEAKEFTNQHGTYRGGYYPIAYDYEKSSEAFRNEQAKTGEYKQYSTAKAATEQGHAQARTQNVNRPIRLSLDVLSDHHKNVVHDIEFRRAIIDVSRFLANKDVKTALVNARGIKGYASIGDWVKAAASKPADSREIGASAMRWLRFKAVMFNMAYNLKLGFKVLPENVVNIADEVGLAPATRAIGKYFLPEIVGGYDGGRNKMHATVMEKSAFMKFRAEHMDRDMSDLIEKYRGTQSGVRHLVNAHAFFVHACLDMGVSIPMWADVYTGAVAEHGDERLAVHQADEKIKRTFMSSTLDKSELMRDGSELRKAATTAFGYMSMMVNRFIRTNAKFGQAMREGNGAVGLAVAAKSYAAMFAAPIMIKFLAQEFSRNSSQNEGGDDEKEQSEMMKRFAEAAIVEGTPIKMLPWVRDIAPYAIKKGMGEHAASLQMTPVEAALTTLLDPAIDLGKEAFGHDTKLGEHSLKAVSFLTGVPLSVDNMVLNFMDWHDENGEATWRDFMSRRAKK